MDAAESRYGIFLDPDAGSEAHTVFDLDGRHASASAVAEGLATLYAVDPDLDEVTIVAGERTLGNCTRAWLTRLAGGANRLGEGDRASQPGESTHYEVLRFVCVLCERRAVRLMYDERDLPACPEAGHGAMELRP